MTIELAASLTATDDDRLFQAQAMVRTYCGWHIAPSRDDTYTPSGYGPAVVILPSLYVTAVTMVTRGGVELIPDIDYTHDGLILRLPYWGLDEVVVEFTHGFDEVPEEVTAVVQALAARAIGNPGGGGVTSRTAGPFSETYGASSTGAPLSLVESDRAALAPYRIIKVS